MKHKSLILIPALVFTSTLLAACGGGSGSGASAASKKTVVNISAYNGGFDLNWLRDLKEQYEELNKDYVNGDKTGVEINIVTATSTAPEDSSNVTQEDYDLYFCEDIPYLSWANKGVFLDLTETFNSVNPYDNKTIASKLDDQVKDAYTMSDKIYGLPYSFGNIGIVYNKTLFQSNGLYLSKSGGFTKKDSEKSAGPDGDYDTTYDNGLPATYAEFFKVCDKIITKGAGIPFTWPGASKYLYLTEFVYSMMMNNEGYSAAMNHLYMDKTATNLGTIVDGEFVNDENSTAITTANGYELSRSKSEYDALSFLYKLMNNTAGSDNLKYYEDQNHSDITNNLTHYESQTYFTNGWGDQDIFMSIEGTWFECECKKHIANYDSNASDLGFMPLPRASVEDLSDEERQPTLFDSSNSLCFVKGNIADEHVKDRTLDFLKFVYSDNGLKTFTKHTNSFMSVNYDLTDEEVASLSTFGQSQYYMRKNGKVIHQLSSVGTFSKNWTYLRSRNAFKTEYANTPIDNFTNKSKTAEEYFTDTGKYYKNHWSSLN